MTNLWEFLLRTMEVSWAALFLLILKRLLSGVSQVTLPGSTDSHGYFFVKRLTAETTGFFSQETAAARLAPCTTAAGALDTFAKGMMYLNPVWLTASSPDSAQEQVTLVMDTVRTGNLQFNGSFYVHNPEKLEDQSYRLLLVFPTEHLYSGSSSLTDETSPEKSSADPIPAEQQEGYFVFPVTVFRDAGRSWAVKSSGSYRRVITDNSIRVCGYGSDFLPVLTAEKEGAAGIYSRTSQYILQVQQLTDTPSDTMTMEIFNYGPYVSAHAEPGAADWNGQISTGFGNSFDSNSRTGSFPELPETAFCRFFLFLDGTVREQVIFTGKEETVYEN